jgi:hypothetical protein
MAGRLSLVWVAEACVATDDRALGAHVLRLLPPLANRLHCWSMLALVAERPVTHALGILSTQQGRHDDAVRWLDDARTRAVAISARPHVALIDLDLAAARLARDGAGAGDRDAVRARLDEAAETIDTLGLGGLEPRLAELRGAIGGTYRPTTAAPSVPGVEAFSMCREGDVWRIRGQREFRLKDSRGLQILARLLEHEGRELHVVDLMAPSGEVVVTSDAGPALDAPAIAAYRRRLQTLRAEEHEAEAWSDAARLDKVRAEIEALAAELAAGVGLGGRSRRTRSTAEKARINVRQRLAHAIGKIEAHDPELARHLRWALRTGNFCTYDPSRR